MGAGSTPPRGSLPGAAEIRPHNDCDRLLHTQGDTGSLLGPVPAAGAGVAAIGAAGCRIRQPRCRRCWFRRSWRHPSTHR
jgi:hypothetical protein